MARSVAHNAIANVLQMVIGAVLLFVLYRYISTTLGVDKLGVWSVVLATASASRLADLGLSAGVTRFVARDLAREQPNSAAQVVETVVVTLAVFVALVLAGVYPFLGQLLAYLFDAEYLPQALEILPFAMVSLWLTIVASVAQSGLDGCQLMAPRAVLVVLGQGMMVILAFALVPQWGLMGLAWAQIGQGIFLLVGSWLLLRRCLPDLSVVPRCWHRPIFREMLSYGVNVQAANVLMLLFDPLTKALMAKFGGPSAAGYFDIANQVALRARSLIVAANQAIVPRIAQMGESAPMQLPELYRQNIRMLVLVALPIHTLLFAWGGLLSQMLLGAYQLQFVYFLQVSALAWLLNIFAGPAYFINMGVGFVGLNAISNFVMGASNLLIGWILGGMYGAVGVVWGYAMALMLGSVLLITIFQTTNVIRWRELALEEHIPLAVVCLLVALVGLEAPELTLIGGSNYTRWVIIIFLPLLTLFVPLWLHPLRRVLLERIFGVPSRGGGDNHESSRGTARAVGRKSQSAGGETMGDAADPPPSGRNRTEGGRRTVSTARGAQENGEPLVTIITVVYNGEVTLEKCIQSVIAQSYKNVEYIIIDGGSRDRTLQIIERYSDHIDYWISEGDSGIYEAMNKGLQLATGDYIGMLNSDDWLEPGGIEILLKAFGPGVDYVYGDVYVADVEGRLIGMMTADNSILAALPYRMPFPHQTFYVRREVINAVGGYDTSYRLSADLDLVCRVVLCQACKGAYAAGPIGTFRIGGASGGVATFLETRVIATKYGMGHLKSWVRLAESLLKVLLVRILPSDVTKRIRRVIGSKFKSIG